MRELNLKFGQVPFWSICRFGEISKIEIMVFSFICAKRFRKTETADCSRSEICEIIKLDKSQISVAIKKLKAINWLTEKSKTKWFIPEIEPAKVEESSTKKSTKKVDESLTKVEKSSTKVDDSSTRIYKEHSSDNTDKQKNKDNADKSAGFENQSAFTVRDKMTATAKQSPKPRSPAFKSFWEALFAFHKKRLNGVIADYAAQNMAICWLFDNNFSRDECLTLYAEQVKELKPNGWRSMVSWLTVKKQIPDWLSQGKPIIGMKKGTNNNERSNTYENIRNDKGNSKSTLDGIRRTIRAKSEQK